MNFHEETHFEKTIEDADGIKFAVALCNNSFMCDSTEDIQEVTCIECLKKYIKLYTDIPKHQLILCHEKKVRDLQLHVKKLQREVNIHTQRERLKGEK